MKRIKTRIALLSLFLMVAVYQLSAQNPNLESADDPTTFIANDPNFHIYICFGQSNMAGTGDLTYITSPHPANLRMLYAADNAPAAPGTDQFEYTETTPWSHIIQTKEKGSWYPIEQTGTGHANSKLGVSNYFARKMAEDADNGITIGIINISVGSASMDLFQKDKAGFDTYIQGLAVDHFIRRQVNDFYDYDIDGVSNPPSATEGLVYQRIVEMANLAKQRGVIKGFVIHQGESTNSPLWPSKTAGVLSNLITDLSLPNDTPILAGQLTRVNTGFDNFNNTYIHNLDDELATDLGVTVNDLKVGIVSSESIPTKDDNLHFTDAGYQTFGERYATTMQSFDLNQESPPWDFNNTDENFVASNFSSITTGATYATYTLSLGTAFKNLRNQNAQINTSVGNYIELTIQNLTSIDRVQVITNDGSGNNFTNQAISVNDTEFKTYYIDMSSAPAWTGTLSDINFRFIHTDNTEYTGDIYIDNIDVVASIPTPPSETLWDFNNTDENFVASNSSSITVGATYATYNMTGGSDFPNLRNQNAQIDTSVGNYIELTIQNLSSIDRVQVITNGTNFTPHSISANDTEFKIYYIDMSANPDWTGTLSDINFRFKDTDGSANSGDVYIDNIDVVASIQLTSRTDFTFNNPSDDGGMVAAGGGLLTQDGTTGVMLVDTNENAYNGLSLNNTFQVPATDNNFVALTFDSHTATNLNQISFVALGASNQFYNIDNVVPNAGVQQTVVFNLTSSTNWDGDVSSFTIQFRYVDNGAVTAFPDNQVVKVHRILFFNTQFTGNGDTSSDWNTTSNWSTGVVPTATDVVHIPSGLTNNPIISSSTGAATNDLIVDGSLTIDGGGSLIVSGTSTGNVTYNRTLTSKPANADGWHLVSSPVAGEVFDNDYVTNNTIASGSNSNLGIATYSSGWTYLQSPSGSISSTSGIGYSMKRSADGTVGFTGTINTADVNGVAVSASATDFVLLGVPYTAYMSSDTFLTANANLDQSQIWVWEQGTTGGNYIAATAKADNFILAPGQGFFVKKATTDATVNFAESSQQSNADTFKKSSRTEVKLLVNDGKTERFAKMYYLNNVTKGYDLGYEGETFGGVETNFDIFSYLVEDDQGKNYQVQSLPFSEMESTIVPLGLKVGADQEVTISAETLNLPTGLKVYVEDRLTNTFTRLDEANTDYKVQVTSGTTEGRFYLHTKSGALLSTDTALLNTVSIYKSNARTLRIVGLSEGKANVKLFNLLGKQVMTSNFNTTGVKELTLPKLSMGVYIVQLETENGKLNKKIVLE